MVGQMAPNYYDRCHSEQTIKGNESPVTSAIMFSFGIFGNVAALVILEIRRRKDSRSYERRQRGLFLIFVNALVFTDLAGTCFITPIVQLAYARNKTLVGMTSSFNDSTNSSGLCEYFGVSMTFFSLATISLLFITALDRCFAIGHPYMYNRLVSKKWAYITIPVMFFICTLFCLLPLVDFGDYVQYCPGTWCFIDMNPMSDKHRVYAILYATIMLVLVLSVVACNLFVMKQLFRMYRRRNRQNSVMKNMRSSSERKILVAHEVEHIIPLVVMTIIFIICTMPLVIRVYINASKREKESHEKDLTALRFISINSIIDPWVFILLNPSVLHFFCLSFCKAPLGKFRDTMNESTLTKENGGAHLTLWPQTVQTDCPHTDQPL